MFVCFFKLSPDKYICLFYRALKLLESSKQEEFIELVRANYARLLRYDTHILIYTYSLSTEHSYPHFNLDSW